MEECRTGRGSLRLRADIAIEVLGELVPQLDAALVGQVRGRIGPTGPSLRQGGQFAAAVLTELEALWRDGRKAFFRVIRELMATCEASGYHLPRAECVRAIEKTGQDEGDALTAYEKWVAASRFSSGFLEPRGLLVMTVHQSKGKEFDAVIIAFANEEAFPDNLDGRRLLYVGLTRGRRQLAVVGPDRGQSALMDRLR